MNSLNKNRLIVLSAIVLSIITTILLSSNSGYKYFNIRKEVDHLNIKIDELNDQNEELAEEINKLKNDRQYLEEIARRQYGFLKKGEMVFDFNK